MPLIRILGNMKVIKGKNKVTMTMHDFKETKALFESLGIYSPGIAILFLKRSGVPALVIA